MFEINPYMTNEVYMRQGDKDEWVFCEEHEGTVMTFAILYLKVSWSNTNDWEITKIELTTDPSYEKKSRNQRFARELLGEEQNRQAREYFKNTPSESIWIDRYVQQECDGMGEREYDKFRHEAA